MAVLFISETYVKNNTVIDEKVDMRIILPSIADAQELRIHPILGSPLYDDLKDKITATTLTANATTSTYQWLDCDDNYAQIPGETNQSFTATVNGSYAVEVTENNCADTSTCELVNNSLIMENNFENIPLLYPNPTTGELTLELGNVYETITLNVRTVIGQLVSTHVYESKNKLTFEIKDLPGIYIIECLNEKGASAR